MKRLQKAAILADLAKRMRDHGSWCGETHLQKAVYFLQELLKVPLGYGYILYKHGPFSFDLRDEITELRVYELFRLETRPVPYGPSLRPTDNAEELKSRFPKTLDNYNKHLAFIAEALDGKRVAELERMATALFVSLEAENGEPEARARHIHALKPHVSLDLALKAVKEIDIVRKKAEKLISG